MTEFGDESRVVPAIDPAVEDDPASDTEVAHLDKDEVLQPHAAFIFQPHLRERSEISVVIDKDGNVRNALQRVSQVEAGVLGQARRP